MSTAGELLGEEIRRRAFADAATREQAMADTAAGMIVTERRRQVQTEGWSHSHDDLHTKGELASAACAYARPRHPDATVTTPLAPGGWPWGIPSWKPTPGDPIRQLVKAGALILAEIERLQRKEAREAADAAKGAEEVAEACRTGAFATEPNPILKPYGWDERLEEARHTATQANQRAETATDRELAERDRANRLNDELTTLTITAANNRREATGQINAATDRAVEAERKLASMRAAVEGALA